MRTFLFFILMALANIQLDAQKPKVVASASIFADMAAQIGKDLIDVEMIVPIGGDPHLHEPTPKDAKLAASADIILLNGLTFEGWITELVENSGTKAKIYTITKNVKAIESEVYKGATDPHAWMDVSNGLIYAKNIAEALKSQLKNNKAEIDKNLEAYLAQLNELDAYILKAIETIPVQQRILVTSHDAFAYYGNRYKLKLESIMGISTDADVRTNDMMRVSKSIKENNIPAIFVESTINPKLLQQIAKDADVKIGGELFADSLGDKDSEASTYYDMLKHNTDVIVSALKDHRMTKTIIDQDDSSNNKLMYIILGGAMFLILIGIIFKMNK